MSARLALVLAASLVASQAVAAPRTTPLANGPARVAGAPAPLYPEEGFVGAIVAGRPATRTRGETVFLALEAPRDGLETTEVREVELATGRTLRVLPLPTFYGMARAAVLRAGGAWWLVPYGGVVLRIDVESFVPRPFDIGAVDGVVTDGERIVFQTSGEPRAYRTADHAERLADVRVTHVVDARMSTILASRVGATCFDNTIGVNQTLWLADGVVIQREDSPPGADHDVDLVLSDAATLKPLQRRPFEAGGQPVRFGGAGGTATMLVGGDLYTFAPRSLDLRGAPRNLWDAKTPSPPFALRMAYGREMHMRVPEAWARCGRSAADGGGALLACWKNGTLTVRRER